MSRSPENSPHLSILVLNWNLGKMTQECLASIRANTAGVDYEIVVVDNGSNRQEKTIVRQACGIHGARLIDLNQNLYFGEANNIGVEAARGEFILLLNNDVVVTPGYIGPLLHALKAAHRAGAVGAELRYPDGRLQEAGGYVRPDGWTIRHGLNRAPADILSSAGLHIVDYCSAACLLLRRDIFLQAGGFDPLFDPGYFEDVDLMLRLRAMGLYTYYCADSAVIHKESATSNTLWRRSRRAAIIHRNHRKFVERWGEYIEGRVFGSPALPRFERIQWSPQRAVSDPARHLFLHGPGIISRNRIWSDIVQLASALRDSTHVTFVADEACSRCRVYSIARIWNQELGEFSVARASNIDRQSHNTKVFLAPNRQRRTEIASGDGPLLSHVTDALSRMNLHSQSPEVSY